MPDSAEAVETGAAGIEAAAGEKVDEKIPMKPNERIKECLDFNSRCAASAPGERLMSNCINDFRGKISLALFSISALLFACLLVTPFASAEETVASQRVFASPEAASSALVSASKTDDMNALSSILGQDANQILSSGDPVADNNAREDFPRRYQEMHRLAYDDQGRVILYIGADNWPVPIPLVKKNGGWVFDTAVGKEELLYRRIGRNELFTINVLEDLADAQAEYASEARQGASTRQFAQKIMSDAGKQNGLYWETAEGQPESPIGPLVASATAEGYQNRNGGSPIPFHGYYYKVLTRQGRNAPGGAKNYLINGKMTNGFAFLAYPAQHRASGVMTFMIDQGGILVQKDLGPDTAKLASEMSAYNPDKTWQEVYE
jgi:Protein of unknown function (DUF2950)